MEPSNTPQGNRNFRRLRSHNHQTQGMSAQQLQQLHYVRTRLDDAEQQNALLREEIDCYKRTLAGYRLTIEDKSGECVELKHKVEDLEKRIGSGRQGTGWPFSNMLPGARDGRHSGETEQVANLRAALAEHKEDLASRQEQIRQLKQQITNQNQQLQAQTAAFARELDQVKSKFLIKAPVISDSEIEGQWVALGCLVNQFVLQYLKRPLGPSEIAHIAQDETFCWLPEISSALPVLFLRFVLLESWV